MSACKHFRAAGHEPTGSEAAIRAALTLRLPTKCWRLLCCAAHCVVNDKLKPTGVAGAAIGALNLADPKDPYEYRNVTVGRSSGGWVGTRLRRSTTVAQQHLTAPVSTHMPL